MMAARICVLLIAQALALSQVASAANSAYSVDTENCERRGPGEIPGTARTAFEDGRFLLAAEIAESEGSLKSLAFAARARIADSITRTEGICHTCLVKAEATAQRAITTDYCKTQPDPAALAESHVQLAIAIGFRGRLVDTIEAQSEGLAEKGRAAIDSALKLDPLNVWARASLGGWHLEIVHRGGSILASVIYGANEEEGLKNFRSALAADPGSLLLHYHYALSILALDAARFRGEALAELQAGYKDPRADALTQFTRKRTDVLMEKLKSGSIEEIETLVRRFQGYPD